MMNASFRTAFWAMCLGLTVPMMLFVGHELTNGGKTSANRKNALASTTAGALQSRRNAKSSERALGVRGSRTFEGATLIPLIEPDATSAGVVLDPQLELEPSTSEEPDVAGSRVRALPTGIRPRAEIVADDLRAAQRTIPSRLESQLDEILGQLDRLTNTLANRPAPPDPMQQAVDLLKRLQQAREIQEQAARVPEIPVPDAERKPEPKTESEPINDAPDNDAAEIVPSPSTTSIVEDTPAPAEASRATTTTVTATPPAPAASLGPSLQSKIYRPRYIAVRALEQLASPLLTPGIGRIGAASNETEISAGDRQGQIPTQWDALVVRDKPEVLRKVDRLLRELDVPPERVLVEATVVTLRLKPEMSYGIDLGAFNAAGQLFSIYPADLANSAAWNSAGRRATAAPSIPILAHGTGMKCGILRGDARAFLQVLQAAHQVCASAASQATVVNKQTTEILLGDGLAAATDGARPLSSGTILRIRPIATRDGLVHLDVRPAFDAEGPSWNGGASIREGSLGSQITLHVGETAVVSGFIADHVMTYTYNKSAAGELPVVGQWFRGQAGLLQRTETIVLLTPHLAAHEKPTIGSSPPDEPAVVQFASHNPPAAIPVGLPELDAFPNAPKAVAPPPSSANEIRLASPMRRTSDVSVPEEGPPKRKLRPAISRPRTRKKPTTTKNTGDLSEIPEIPRENEGPQRPVIRPAPVR